LDLDKLVQMVAAITVNVLKSGPVIDPVRALGHWTTGQTNGSLVGPHDY